MLAFRPTWKWINLFFVVVSVGKQPNCITADIWWVGEQPSHGLCDSRLACLHRRHIRCTSESQDWNTLDLFHKFTKLRNIIPGATATHYTLCFLKKTAGTSPTLMMMSQDREAVRFKHSKIKGRLCWLDDTGPEVLQLIYFPLENSNSIRSELRGRA